MEWANSYSKLINMSEVVVILVIMDRLDSFRM